MPKMKLITVMLIATYVLQIAYAKSDLGKYDSVIRPNDVRHPEQRALLANSTIVVKVECKSNDKLNVTISWTLTEYKCWNDGSIYDEKPNQKHIFTKECPFHLFPLPESPDPYIYMDETNIASTESIKPAPKILPTGKTTTKKTKDPLRPEIKPIVIIPRDGIYGLVISITAAEGNTEFTAPIYIEFRGPNGGFISALDWPLLPFYGIMCAVYVVFGIIWLIVSFMQWRDLLRIQFWIGGLILLGMLEKAFFYAEYQSLNSTGVPVPGAELTAEFVSCAKRTLACMLVIIMSLGFGIVKPRLGPMLHRIVGVGALYFLLACVESYLRVMHAKNEERNVLLVASIPLAVLDTGICWWIFTSLVQTTRTLRLRRNMVKLSLYRHFTNTLIFCVIASVIFMLYAMHLRKTENCTPGWHDIWIDTAFWHVLFSVLLLVIMILWRPTNNNQRYAFTPLLDNPEDEDEEEEDQFVADAYGVKMRGSHINNSKNTSQSQRATTTEEDDLRWVEENIPSSMAEPALPVLDSDEEIINTKFEVSKMQ